MTRNHTSKLIDYTMVLVAVAITAGVLLGVMSCAAHAQDQLPPRDCITYGNTVTLTGTVLVRRPPEDMPAGEWFPLIVLDQPICAEPVDPSRIAAANEDREDSVWAIQIMEGPRSWPPISRVRVTGELMHGVNGHHYTSVLISPGKIEQIK